MSNWYSHSIIKSKSVQSFEIVFFKSTSSIFHVILWTYISLRDNLQILGKPVLTSLHKAYPSNFQDLTLNVFLLKLIMKNLVFIYLFLLSMSIRLHEQCFMYSCKYTISNVCTEIDKIMLSWLYQFGKDLLSFSMSFSLVFPL